MMPSPPEIPSVQDDLRILLILEDLERSPDCAQPRQGHPDLALALLLEMLGAPPTREIPTFPCPHCRHKIHFAAEWLRGQPTLRETFSDGTSQLYIIHPELSDSLLQGLQEPIPF